MKMSNARPATDKYLGVGEEGGQGGREAEAEAEEEQQRQQASQTMAVPCCPRHPAPPPHLQTVHDEQKSGQQTWGVGIIFHGFGRPAALFPDELFTHHPTKHQQQDGGKKERRQHRQPPFGFVIEIGKGTFGPRNVCTGNKDTNTSPSKHVSQRLPNSAG